MTGLGCSPPSTTHQVGALGKWLNLSEPWFLERHGHGRQLLGSNDIIYVKKDRAHGRCAIKVVTAISGVVFISPSRQDTSPPLSLPSPPPATPPKGTHRAYLRLT